MDNPFKFDLKNKRVVTNVRDNTANIALGTTFFYLTSLYLYNRKFFRVDGNGVALVSFMAFSLPASYAYGKFIFDSATDEAARINNSKEGH
jgi:hypothetical protein